MPQWVSLNRMPRWLIAAIFALVLAALPAFAQVGQLPDAGSGNLPGTGGTLGTNPVHGPDAESGASADDDPVIRQAREVAVSFAETLPDYIAKQVTNRYWTKSASRAPASWLALDVVTADVVYLSGKENYLNVLDNGKPTNDASQTGAWSEGEFATGLQALFSRLTATEFRNQRPSKIANRTAYRYDFTVEQPHSGWRIEANGQTYKPSYTGAVWIDQEPSVFCESKWQRATCRVDFRLTSTNRRSITTLCRSAIRGICSRCIRSR